MMPLDGDAPPAACTDQRLQFLSTRELQVEHSHAFVERSKGNISEKALDRLAIRLEKLRAELDLRA